MEIIDNKLIGEKLAKAGASARLRQNFGFADVGGEAARGTCICSCKKYS